VGKSQERALPRDRHLGQLKLRVRALLAQRRPALLADWSSLAQVPAWRRWKSRPSLPRLRRLYV